MNAEEAKQLIYRLREGVGQRQISVRCTCENLETVYVMIDPQGDVLVTDDHKTFSYLSRCTDSSYVPYESLDMAVIANLCATFGVSLAPNADIDADEFPSIQCRVQPDLPVSTAIERIADAIEAVFEFAMRSHLK